VISKREELRRLLILLEALWEAREELFERSQREIDRENLDWFYREKFDAALEDHRRVLRAVEALRLQAAYDSEPVNVRCTALERSEAVRLALDILEGKLTPERGVERLLSEGFQHDDLATGDLDGYGGQPAL
jgi:hypothetical protein